jgi:hypothetical protein
MNEIDLFLYKTNFSQHLNMRTFFLNYCLFPKVRPMFTVELFESKFVTNYTNPDEGGVRSLELIVL